MSKPPSDPQLRLPVMLPPERPKSLRPDALHVAKAWAYLVTDARAANDNDTVGDA